MTDLATAWRAALAAELPGAVALRHQLHAMPQVSGAEEPTARRVAAAILAGRAGGDGAADLADPDGADGADGGDGGDGGGSRSSPGRGASAVRLETIAGTGRLLRIGPDGPAVGLRAEMDGLPVAEATGAPFAAVNGAMHACGHDVHLAALVAVVRAARRIDLPAGLVAVLQPREEVGPTGAADVVASGRLLDLDVRSLVAAHVQPLVPAGCVTSDPGPVNASVDEIDIVITGRGGHGAYPHLAADPVPALCRTVLAVPEAARAAVDPLHPVVVTIPQLAGSGAPNVLPGVATASGTVRAMREPDRKLVHDRIGRTVRAIAEAHGCTGEYRIRRGEPALVNDAALAGASASWLRTFGVPSASFASCGSDDFATYGPQVPILMHFVGTGEGPEGPMLHDARYLPGDGTVELTALALLAGWLAGYGLIGS
ncbi:M20 metallopeptidase family protein [Cryptosporangium phraense]|uniref:Amidohydrolase n=1 Tax=Cryptosporangium phraense TaxID=2593070 RepID=A0A545ANY1_9ACTN|nr:M20 family metallopeptidase [Cryptosporangium phraense]TQS42961.1 amidohydrolase [Cryptosporangium phraense]